MQDEAQGAGLQIGVSDDDASNDTAQGLASSDDEDAAPSQRKGQVDTAYVGMGLKQPQQQRQEQPEQGSKHGENRALSLAEQEQLALRLLRRQH